MKIISVMNEKGGVGKTTTSVHLATGLAIAGYRVVLMDADPQANATAYLKQKPRPAIYDLLIREAQWNEKGILTPIKPEMYAQEGYLEKASGQLYLVASNGESQHLVSIQDSMLLRNRLMQLEGSVDYVIIDTSPLQNLFTASLYVSSDYILFVTECEAFSATQGLPKSISYAQRVHNQAQLQGFSTSQVLGIIPTMYDARLAVQNLVLEKLQEAYGELVWEAIPNRVVMQESAYMRQPIYAYHPDHAMAHGLYNMCEYLVELTGQGASA